MVTIVDYKSFEKENGENFFGLVVQGGVESVKSGKTGKMYLTARSATVPTTFNEAICKSLLGSSLEGSIRKIECDTYEYTIKDTGEIIDLKHRYEYVSDEAEIIQKNVLELEAVL